MCELPLLVSIFKGKYSSGSVNFSMGCACKIGFFQIHCCVIVCNYLLCDARCLTYDGKKCIKKWVLKGLLQNSTTLFNKPFQFTK